MKIKNGAIFSQYLPSLRVRLKESEHAGFFIETIEKIVTGDLDTESALNTALRAIQDKVKHYGFPMLPDSPSVPSVADNGARRRLSFAQEIIAAQERKRAPTLATEHVAIRNYYTTITDEKLQGTLKKHLRNITELPEKINQLKAQVATQTSHAQVAFDYWMRFWRAIGVVNYMSLSEQLDICENNLSHSQLAISLVQHEIENREKKKAQNELIVNEADKGPTIPIAIISNLHDHSVLLEDHVKHEPLTKEAIPIKSILKHITPS